LSLWTHAGRSDSYACRFDSFSSFVLGDHGYLESVGHQASKLLRNPVRVVTSGPLPIAEMEHACVLLGCSSHFGDCSCYLSSVNVVAGAWAFSAAGACGEHLTGSLTIWCCQTLAARICGSEGRCYYCSVGANFVGGNFELPGQVLEILFDSAVFDFARVGCFAIVRRFLLDQRSLGPSSSYCAILLDLSELTEHGADLVFWRHCVLISAASGFLLS